MVRYAVASALCGWAIFSGVVRIGGPVGIGLGAIGGFVLVLILVRARDELREVGVDRRHTPADGMEDGVAPHVPHGHVHEGATQEAGAERPQRRFPEVRLDEIPHQRVTRHEWDGEDHHRGGQQDDGQRYPAYAPQGSPRVALLPNALERGPLIHQSLHLERERADIAERSSAPEHMRQAGATTRRDERSHYDTQAPDERFDHAGQGIGPALVVVAIVWLVALGVVLLWDLTVVNGRALAAGLVWSLAGWLAWRLHRTGVAR